MLDRADAKHACSADLFARLVPVRLVVTAAQDYDAVVAKIGEVAENDVKCFLFAFSEEAIFLLLAVELVDDLSQEVDRVRLIHLVHVHVCNDRNEAPHHLRLRQNVEEAFVFSEFAQDVACVQGLVQVVRVLGRNTVDKRVYYHAALFFEHLLHAELVSSELRLGGGLLLNVKVAVVGGVPFVFLLWLDLLLDQLDEQGGQRVVIDVVQKTLEDLPFLVEQKILQNERLLLVEQLLHNLKEVATKDG